MAVEAICDNQATCSHTGYDDVSSDEDVISLCNQIDILERDQSYADFDLSLFGEENMDADLSVHTSS